MTVWAQGQSRNYGVSNATGRVWALNWVFTLMISWMANPKPAMVYALSECGGSQATASRSRGERADAPCMRPSMFASTLLYMLFLRRPNLCGFCATACLVYFSYSLHMFAPSASGWIEAKNLWENLHMTEVPLTDATCMLSLDDALLILPTFRAF